MRLAMHSPRPAWSMLHPKVLRRFGQLSPSRSNLIDRIVDPCKHSLTLQ
jgi:hypothetical protein